MKLSVVIVSYNVKYFLEQALNSVRKASEGLAVETWVVDNNSADGSANLVREKFPWVRLIANDDNPGFARANNQAIRQASGEFILLLNPDTIVAENTFSKCLSFMDRHPEAGGLGVHMLDGSGQFLPESRRGFPTPWVAFC
ncbi:MAG TPA: glycosyltransferase family 2 protein, partial [Flavilitoribacter sp.]|nr:glycosyltransferase family 2 protein [Flavilitoribacter sp.]